MRSEELERERSEPKKKKIERNESELDFFSK